jgi:hypothetical protein
LGQQIATKLNIGWISTDLLVEILIVKNEDGIKTEWNAAPEAISNDAEWFFPYLERFVWRLTSHTENYVIEGVDFLPVHINQLANQYAVKSVFLGCSNMTLERFDQFPGHTHGYSYLPKSVRQQFVNDIPLWSDYVRKETIRFNYPYVDTYDDFSSRLLEAEALLTSQCT